MAELKLDPTGYFLIRLNNKTNKIEVAFCKYKEIKFTHPKARFGKNTINKKFSSKHPEEILKWIKNKKLISQDSHYNYIKKELERAEECLKKGVKYVQD